MSHRGDMSSSAIRDHSKRSPPIPLQSFHAAQIGDVNEYMHFLPPEVRQPNCQTWIVPVFCLG
jgi:hypothetical protein